MTTEYPIEEVIFSYDKSGTSGTDQFTRSLGIRVVHGVIWTFAIRITNRLFQLVRTIILARFLAPTDFGLFGIALLAISGLETFSQTGLNKALIQKKGNTESYLNTAWTVQVIRGFILGLIAFAIAPFVATFFNAPGAKYVIQVIALSEILKGFTNIGIIYFQKELVFKKQFVYEFCSTLSDLGIAITAAFLLRSVWALVFGVLARHTVGAFLSFVLHPYRPRLQFNRKQFKELFVFGRWILGSSILVFLITQGDNIFVGKLLGITFLGFYQLAFRLSNMPTTEITNAFSKVTFPAFSKLQNNPSRLKDAYFKVFRIAAYLSFPVAGLIFVLAPDCTRIFLGPKWMPIVPAMRILVLAGLVQSITITTSPLLLAIGRPKTETRFQFIRSMVLAASIYPLTLRFGIIGTSIAVLLSNVISIMYSIYIVIRIKVCSGRKFTAMIILSLMPSFLMALVLFILKSVIVDIRCLGFLALTGVGSTTYLSLLFICDRSAIYRIGQIIRDLYGDIRYEVNQ